MKPAKLDLFADTLGQADDGLATKYVNQAVDYCDRWVKLKSGSDGMLFGLLVGKVNDLSAKIDGNYRTVSSKLDDSADGLHDSSRDYKKQELATARHLDEVYKPGGVTPLDDGVDTDAPKKDPTSVLTEPGADGAVPDLVQQILDGAGFFSESALVLKIISVCGLDVEGWVKERFAGDFEAVAKSRNAVKNLAKFDDEAASTVAAGASDMFDHWHGSAASGARSYFDKMANGVESHSLELQKVAQRYDAIVIAIQQAGSFIINALTDLIDWAAEAAASLAAAGCLQEVPVLNVIIDIIGASRVFKIIKQIHHIATIWNRVWYGNGGALALITHLVGGFAGFDVDTEIPKRGYENKAIGAN